ncbi:MAG: nucleotidyl transferase AbiEii/AbiGii toxin family protein [Proteobacteria bacterium]|nr:nucleotidyl transferase AbiEii/AbiGii toxin family protein [Pseudomonadota bacterium]
MLKRTSYINPNLSILPSPQQILFPELKDTPSHFILCGGTAIALRLGHRISVDFDFFSRELFDPDKLYHAVPYLEGAEVLQKEENTLTCLVDRKGPVKISFFGGLTLDYIYRPEIIEGPNIKVASLLDLAGMKAAVIQKRAASRDYIDINALMEKAGIDLITLLAAGSLIYGKQFNPYLTLKALVYFNEGDLETLPKEIKNRFRQTVKTLEIDKIPKRVLELKKIKEKEEKC